MLKKQGLGIFLFSSVLSSWSRAPESMNIIAEVEEGGRRKGKRRGILRILHILLLLHLRTLGTSCAAPRAVSGQSGIRLTNSL